MLWIFESKHNLSTKHLIAFSDSVDPAMCFVWVQQMFNYRPLARMSNLILFIQKIYVTWHVAHGCSWSLLCGSVAQWIARRTSSGYNEDIRRLWVRVPPESILYICRKSMLLDSPCKAPYNVCRCWKLSATRMGFEPTRAEHNGLAVHRLNHSATSST